MTHRIEDGYLFECEYHRPDQRKGSVNAPEYFERIEDAGDRSGRCDFVALGTEDVMRPGTSEGDRQKERQYPDTADPLGEGPPEENASGHGIEA